MNKTIAVAFALFIAMLASDTQAATFTVSTGVNTMVIYSTSTDHEACRVRVNFSYLKDGKRLKGQQLCQNGEVFPGEKREFCKVTNDELVSVQVEGEPQAECKKIK